MFLVLLVEKIALCLKNEIQFFRAFLFFTKPNQTIPIYLSPPSHAHFNTENVDQPFFNVIHLGLLTHAILLAENMIGQNF